MQFTTSQILLAVICALLLFIYLRHPTTYSPGVDILQAPLETLDPQVFLERYPVVIPDRVVDVHELSKPFQYLYSWKHNEAALENTKNGRLMLAKYTLLHNGGQSTATVSITHPSNADMLTLKKSTNGHFLEASWGPDTAIPTTGIRLHPHQTLVLPTNWIMFTEHAEQLHATYMYDIPHYVTSKLRHAFSSRG